MKSKTETASVRIKILLEVLSAFSFHLYYTNGKKYGSDFLSQVEVHKSNSLETFPISFDLQDVLQEKYHILTQDMEHKKQELL